MNENDYNQTNYFNGESNFNNTTGYGATSGNENETGNRFSTGYSASGNTMNSRPEPEKVEADKIYEPQSGYGSFNYDFSRYNSYQNQSSFYHNNTQPLPEMEQPKTSEKKKNTGLKVLCCVLAAVFLITGGALGARWIMADSSQNTTSSQSSSSSSEGKKGGVNGGSVVINAKAEEGALTTTEIAQIAKKSSVGVLVYSTKQNSINFGYGGGSSDDSNMTGEGTGVIIQLDNQGDYTFVVTCAHVISDANISVKIMLEDGTTYNADIVGYDEKTDVGLLRVNNKDLQQYAANVGSSSDLQVGQSVFAIGNPGGSDFFGSFTGGVVSAIGRTLSSSSGYTMECIQHDAAINPGNSGGGLYNAQGQLVGINSSKIASTEYEGMSFAIPIDEAVNVINNLSSFGYVPDRPKLGINYSLARSYNQAFSMIVSFKGLPSGTLLITKIASDSSLNSLGVKAGDMIVSANGKKLDTADVLLNMIDSGKVGDVIELGICRIETNGSNYEVKEFTVKATLVEDKGVTNSEEQQDEKSKDDYFDYFNGN